METEDLNETYKRVDVYKQKIILRKNDDSTATQKLEILKDLHKKQTKYTITMRNYMEDQFADLLLYELKLMNFQWNTTTSFGETVFVDDILKPNILFKMDNLKSTYIINRNSEFSFFFIPENYMDGQIKMIERSIYEPQLYNFALKFLIQKIIMYKQACLKKKKQKFTKKFPVFCETFFSERKFIIDCNFNTNFPLLKEIIYHNQHVNPSCSLFGINIHLRYLKKSVKINNTVISVKDFSAI